MCWQSTHVFAGAFPHPSSVPLLRSWGEHHWAVLDPSLQQLSPAFFCIIRLPEKPRKTPAK